MKIAITGSSGFLGQEVVKEAQQRGWIVIPIVRKKRANAILWDAKSHFENPEELEGFDAVINLAGESVFSFWTNAKKKTIFESRVSSTKLLALTLANCQRPPTALISVSAVGYYGDTGEDWATPATSVGSTFLAHTCEEWEKASRIAKEAGIRVTNPRLGLIMDKEGGVLPTIIRFFKMGLGSVLGSGNQWISWIGKDDAAKAICDAVTNPVDGPWNLVTPEPLRQKDFARLLAQKIHRPLWFRIPTPILKGLGGELAENLLLTSCRASPSNHLNIQLKNIEEIIG